MRKPKHKIGRDPVERWLEVAALCRSELASAMNIDPGTLAHHEGHPDYILDTLYEHRKTELLRLVMAGLCYERMRKALGHKGG